MKKKKYKKKILVTCAFPYSNGPIHIGHLLEHIQADIWVKYQKMKKNKVYFICSDDSHGTAVMLQARKKKINPKQLIQKIYKEHKKDLLSFSINYDLYNTTHNKTNKTLTKKIYSILNKKNLINEKKIVQFYDYKEKIFLSDRFIQGTCPICNANNQYGDNCELCGSTYKQIELINPISSLSKLKPILKKTKHSFFNLPLVFKKIKNWIFSGNFKNEITNEIKKLIDPGIKEWNISRDKPYFGFKIPKKKEKYFYVWLDATIGYIGCFKNLCKKRKINFNSFWNKNSKTKFYQFIGKDIIYFHFLFWPSILESINYKKPNNIFVHGHLTINGAKMSKSKKRFITAKSYLKNLDSDYLRYFYASKLSNKINDINFNLKEFIEKINSDIVNKLINLISRNASFINRFFSNKLHKEMENSKIYKIFINSKKEIEKNFISTNYNKIIKKTMLLVDLANNFINEKKPWILNKKQKNRKKVHKICTLGINLFRIIIIYLKPIIPKLTKKIEEILNENLNLEKINKPLLNHEIKKFKPLVKRLNENEIKFHKKEFK